MVHPSAYKVLITFGKHKGRSFGFLVDNDPSYLQWLIDKDGIPVNWKTAAFNALHGISMADLSLPIRLPPTSDNGKIELFVANPKTGKIGVVFPIELKEKFKENVDGWTWNKDEYRWEINKAQIVAAVECFGGPKNIHIDDYVKQVWADEWAFRDELERVRGLADIDIDVPTLLPLRAFQKVAIAFGEARGDRWMDADDMGLGKTPTSIGWALRKGGKSLIIVPNSVVLQWQKEIKKFAGLDSCVWSSTGHTGDIESQFHVINYDAVVKYIDKFIKMKFRNMICDEATKLKNYKTIRTKSIMGSWKEPKIFPGIKTPNLLLLTGTPILNSPKEYFTLLSFIDKARFNRPDLFINRYGNNHTDARNLKELYNRAKLLFIRRLKKHVAKEIPKKSRNPISIAMTAEEQKRYIALLGQLFSKWAEAGRPSAAQMPAIRNHLFNIKMPRIIDFVDETLEAERKILVFAIQQEHIERIATHYGNRARFIHGGVSIANREKIKMEFIKGKVDVLALTIATGGMGIDGLQEVCSDSLFCDRGWTPGEMEQAEDRLNRIGQLEPSMMNYLSVAGSIDEQMELLLMEKQAIIDAAVDGLVNLSDIELRKLRNSSIFRELVKFMGVQLKEGIDVEEDPVNS